MRPGKVLKKENIENLLYTKVSVNLCSLNIYRISLLLTVFGGTYGIKLKKGMVVVSLSFMAIDAEWSTLDQRRNFLGRALRCNTY